jgi:hypothetical protein
VACGITTIRPPNFFCAYNTSVGWRNITEKMHMTAALTKWYDEHGRHEIFAGDKSVRLKDKEHSLVLREEIVTNEAQHDLDRLGIAKNLRTIPSFWGAGSDFNRGWLRPELEKNLATCIRDKSGKIAPYRSKYPEWRLVLVDHMMGGTRDGARRNLTAWRLPEGVN